MKILSNKLKEKADACLMGPDDGGIKYLRNVGIPNSSDWNRL